jgi:hypothetical protein
MPAFEIPGRPIVNDDYGRLEFVTKSSEWRSEIFFYPATEIHSFQVLWADLPKLPLNKIKLPHVWEMEIEKKL